MAGWCGALRFAVRDAVFCHLMTFLSLLYHCATSAHFIFACGCRFPLWHFLPLPFGCCLSDFCSPVWPQLPARCFQLSFRPLPLFALALPEFCRRFTQTSQNSSLPILPSSFTFSLQSAPLPYFSRAFTRTLQSTFTPSFLRLYTSITNFFASYCGTLYARITKPSLLLLFFLYLNFTLRGSLSAHLLYQV